MTFGVCIASSVVYCIFGSTDVQPWNTLQDEDGKRLEEVHPDALGPTKRAEGLAEEATNGAPLKHYGATQGQ